jgi:hypothetical protein
MCAEARVAVILQATCSFCAIGIALTAPSHAGDINAKGAYLYM